MVKNCYAEAAHKVSIGKYCAFLGTYEISMKQKELAFITICDIHMKADMMKHPWSKQSQIVLSITEKECALCKMKVSISNGSHCVKHMLTIGGKSFNTSCNFYDKKIHGQLLNDTKFHHDHHVSDSYICMECRDHYDSIKQLDKQHLKYIKMLASITPICERSSVSDHKHQSSHVCNLKDYAVYCISNSITGWEVHIHSDTEISICKWDTSTRSSSKMLTITKGTDGFTFKFLLWNKPLPTFLFPPKLTHMLSLQDFHIKIYEMVDKLNGYNFCEGIHTKEALDIVELKQQADLFVDHSLFITDDRIIERALRSTTCEYYTTTKSKMCSHCNNM